MEELNSSVSTIPTVDTEGEADNEVLNRYLSAVCFTLLDLDKDFFYQQLHQPNIQKMIRAFALERNHKVLVITKIMEEGPAHNISEEQVTTPTENMEVVFSIEISAKVAKGHSIAFVKREQFGVLDLLGEAREEEFAQSSNSIASQLQVLNLGFLGNNDTSPFEITQTYLQNCFVPLFGALDSGKGAQEEEVKSSSTIGLSRLQKKLAELIVVLIQCKQNLEIPDIQLNMDSHIKAMAKKAVKEGRKLTIEDFNDKISDQDFLGNLQYRVNQWIKEIRKVTKLERDPSTGSALQEINFWLGLEKVLNHIKEQVEEPEVEMTLAILNQARRFYVVITFQRDIELEGAVKKVKQCNELMRNFPIHDLFSANSIDQIASSLDAIFKHLKKYKNSDAYPVQRVLFLIEALSRDLSSQLIKTLASIKLLQLEWNDFSDLMGKCEETIFKQWDQQFKNFRDHLRRFLLSSRERVPMSQSNFDHLALQERLNELLTFRRQHQKLQDVIRKTLQGSGVDSEEAANTDEGIKEIENAYEIFLKIDVLDLSKEGLEKFDNARRAYDLKIDRVEGQITSQLRDKLASSINASEMFRVFSKFNALFFRPRIKGAIQEYQTQLLSTVKKDIEKLREKFLIGYANTQAAQMNKLRDIKTVSGKIIWARQIERKLKIYLERVRDVLGPKWEEHPEGKRIKELGNTFLNHLNMRSVIDNWFQSFHGTSSSSSSDFIFAIVQKRDSHVLVVNYDETFINLFKEARNLANFGFQIPFGVTRKVEEFAESIFPNAVSLLEILKSFYGGCSLIDQRTTKLIAKYKKDVQTTLSEGFTMRWIPARSIENYIQKLSEKVQAFEEAANDLKTKMATIEQALNSLGQCPLEKEALNEHFKTIQTVIDECNFKQYSNLQLWVEEMDKKIEKILAKRLSELIPKWIEEFCEFDAKGGSYIDYSSVHEIKIQDQQIYLEPPIEEARAFWFQQFHTTIEIICGLTRIESSRYDKIWEDEESRDTTYRNILFQVPKEILMKSYSTIEQTIRDAEEYASTWLKYQSLWDIEASNIFSKLGDDMNVWQQLLNEIRQGRSTFDNSATERHFGAIVIDYRAVQAKVNNKYDSWHKEILNKFGGTLSENMKSFYQNISNARINLETRNLDVQSADVTAIVTEIQEIKKQMTSWQEEMDRYRSGQKLLDRQRFHFPSDWLWVDQIEGEWSAFKQILSRKSKAMEDQIPTLQAKIMAEEQSINDRIKALEDRWRRERPDGDVNPSVAIDTLTIIEQLLTRLKEDYLKICKAKELLQLDISDPERLNPLEEDIQGLKAVWSELNKVWSILVGLKDTPFSNIIPKKVKDSLDESLEMMNNFPNRLRMYDAFENMSSRIKRYKKMQIYIPDLKSESMKPRHWKILLPKLKLNMNLNDITLGTLWNVDLIRHDLVVKDVLNQARGEMILEDFLRGIKEYWGAFELDLVRYQNKCRLIRGWDDLFAKIDEHISNLGSMKISPYYKVFEEEVAPWDDKLQKMRIIFDVWIDVQRRWIYLEGIFFGSADIKNQLQSEYTRFKGIDNEFISLMKKVSGKPNILEVMNIPNLQRSLERLAELLSKIQKALGDYLETQRSRFARFYFVGDEDLLEIIGNSKDVTNVQRHFPKMFAGITILKNQEGDILEGMNSKEGEYVEFSNQIKISEDPTIHVWLTKIENQMQISLANKLEKAVDDISRIDKDLQPQKFLEWIELFPAQIVLLSLQVIWSEQVEKAIEKKGGFNLNALEGEIGKSLVILAERVLTELPKDIRQKYEQLITDLVHERDVVRLLDGQNVSDIKDFLWLYYMRFYWHPRESDALKKLQIVMANATFYYGFEYLGVGEKLVQTPLTDRCYLTLTQALHYRMGGSPFGPAGTGKTESVKALGAQLGTFVLVFNCDETFDFQAMGRIFVGLCQVGAWGCFDEFNRLEERMLSAVSQQILTIQAGLREKVATIDILGKEVKVNSAMGIFVTMNPGYAGRSNLPDNLKQLFRQFAMVKPDRELIAQVMLYSQGFKSAERLSGKIVSLFELCASQLSEQPHYDFGLRALKSVLVSAGNLKRASSKSEDAQQSSINEWEQNVLLKSVCDTVVPKLIASDIPLLSSLLSGVFPGSDIMEVVEDKLMEALEKMCPKFNLQFQPTFINKVMQLYQIQNLHHGVMMVGPSGSGKSAAWRILLDCLYYVDGVKGESYIVDPKAVSKEELYGKLDSTTLEWTDGIFTHILRKILDNVRGESSKRHWIIFDGDVDPEWAENLNSVLDDNKLLTLPSGERLSIPPNVRIMFEVESLKNATLATVSRCGMVWFSHEIITLDMIYSHYLNRLQQEDFDALVSESYHQEQQKEPTPNDILRQDCVKGIKRLFEKGEDESLISKCIEYAESQNHVMEFTKIRVLEGMFALVRKGITNVLEYNESHPDFPLSSMQIENYMTKWVIMATLWGIGGSMNLKGREMFGNKIAEFTDVPLPSIDVAPLLDYEVRIEEQEWCLWKKKVVDVDIDSQKVVQADVVITTVDTLRHQEVLCSWLSEHRPFLLCGPPGSGKTMTLMATLKALPDFDMVFVNFSSSTTPNLLLQTFDHYCEYKKTPSGIVLRPHQPNKWLVVFCDEINLPDIDKYGTQAVITFLRQLTEQNGFWRPTDKSWIKLERIQFVGACNPPTDAGRHPMSPRFLRHAPLILVDFPGEESLRQIYGTFNRAMLKRLPSLRQYADSLTNAMVEFYTSSQRHFTSEMQPHYIYSPRELTRWKYAVFEALIGVNTVEDLVRLYVHEGLRLFQDRLVFSEEKEWCDEEIDRVALSNFSNIDPKCLERPILFTTYLSKNYISVEREELRDHICARLKVFYEEELNVPLVVFDSVLDHIVRIDRVLRQPLGHLLLVGASGVGKTTLSRFVSWMNNLNVFQIKAGRNYSVADFDEDLRAVMRRAGVKLEKICFIFDESNVLSTAFLERMNALLASGEVPGLFDGDEYTALINQCKEAYQKEGKLGDTEDELYKTFTANVQRNLHVVFTMNPANPDFSNRTASSPALFNRCVIDWFGEWSEEGLWQVAKEFTKIMELPDNCFTDKLLREVDSSESTEEVKHNALVNSIVKIHNSVKEVNTKLAKSAKKYNFITPRDFLDFIKHFVELHGEKKEELEEQQLHLNVGLNKLKETEAEVIKLQEKLNIYKDELAGKEKLANEKLQLMVQEQNQAEQKREISIKSKAEIAIKQEEISKKSAEAQNNLARAEPALKEAESSVNSIEKGHLNELKAMRTPPALVKSTIEAVICLIKGKTSPPTWKNAIKILCQEGFINKVINFDRNSITADVKKAIKENYVGQKDWDPDRINRASRAAGPLSKWVTSIIDYAEILISIAPLRNTLAQLEKSLNQLSEEDNKLEALIAELEQNIANYKADYAVLIAEVQNIKTEMQKVQDKVSRSQQLIRNLYSERTRWEASSSNFQDQVATLVGDVLRSGAFLTYTGFFDYFYRVQLDETWKDYLEVLNIKFKSDLALVEFLSKPNDRLSWQSHSLPSDTLCIENAIIMSKFNRYPLIIDPSGQAMEFISSYYASKKILKTSFADDAFMKNLESALRFGCPLLVQDVEKIDPILNSVLNKELHKTGGRVLIRVGDQEIDFMDSFTMFMITRDPHAVFTPDLCSRVTFINFTVTPSSLQNQCMNIFLKNERPEVDKKRSDLLKIQGEYKVKLRELEDSLLNALNKTKGNILDNDEAIATLENLKKQSAEIAKEIEQSDEVMKEIELVSNQYLDLAIATSRIYFCLDSLNTIHFLYEYSLQAFMQIVFDVLIKNENVNKIGKEYPDMRLEVIFTELFNSVYHRVGQGLLNKDKMILALRMVQIRMGKKGDQEMNLLLKSSSLFKQLSISSSLLQGKLNNNQLKMVEELNDTEMFAGIVQNIQDSERRWLNFIDATNAEEAIPECWSKAYESKTLDSNLRNLLAGIKKLILLKTFRPDRFIPGAMEFITLVLGPEFTKIPEVDLASIIDTEITSKSPLLLVSAPGYDPSYKVDNLAKQLNKHYASVAIGSAEGFDLAEKSILSASKTGTWVLLKNIHLAPQWLVELEKKLHRLNPHEKFRLFLTMEINPKVPTTLVRMSRIFVFEPPAGIKASLQRTYATVITEDRSEKLPVERSRLHFLISWFHAVVQERLRYTPIGWSKHYEFNESDQRCALDSIDEWIDREAQSRTNIPPEKIPFSAIRTLLSQSIYGGKIDNDFDQTILLSLIDQLFRAESFDKNFPLFKSGSSSSSGQVQMLHIPDCRKRNGYMDWIENLPKIESPLWSGLPVNVEKILKAKESEVMIAKLKTIQGTSDEEEMLSKEKQTSAGGDSKAKWLAELQKKVEKLLEILPAKLDMLHRTANAIKNPLFRFLEREVTIASNLLVTIKADMVMLLEMCKGNIKSTNQLRKLAENLHSDVIPQSWRIYSISNIPATEWVLDFSQRLKQLEKLSKSSDFGRKGIWLGGLLFPEAYLTATRQAVAQEHKWSLEELDLIVQIGVSEPENNQCFIIENLAMEGAEWSQKDKKLVLSDNLSISLPPVMFKWIRKSESAGEKNDLMQIPVYLNNSRIKLLFSVKLSSSGTPLYVWYQRGVALISWNKN